jgi:hypothetical protein
MLNLLFVIANIFNHNSCRIIWMFYSDNTIIQWLINCSMFLIWISKFICSWSILTLKSIQILFLDFKLITAWIKLVIITRKSIFRMLDICLLLSLFFLISTLLDVNIIIISCWQIVVWWIFVNEIGSIQSLLFQLCSISLLLIFKISYWSLILLSSYPFLTVILWIRYISVYAASVTLIISHFLSIIWLIIIK